MTDTAPPETGPVDAPASMDDIIAEIAAGEESSDALEAVTEELVNEAEGESESSAEPESEDEETEPAEVEDEESDEDEAETEESNPEEQSYTVKVNGEEREVPLSELLKGYSRTEDYKAKTTAVAEQRRDLEAKAERVEAEAQAKYANQLEEATNLFAQFDPVLSEARTINWEQLKATNPSAYVHAQDAVQARMKQLNEMQERAATARQQSQERQQAIAQQERAQRFDAAADEIVKAMPELADEAKFSAFAGAGVQYLKDTGFSGEEIADALDHRVLTLADKARRWDAHLAAQKSLPEKKIVPKSKVKAMTTDGSGSRASKPRMPSTTSRERRADWVAQQILEDL